MAGDKDATVHAQPTRRGKTFVVGDYTVDTKPLGRGGMATVYRATDPAGRQVALKELQPHLARDREMKKRFRQEYDVVAGLKHDHVVRFLDYLQANQTYYIVMEFVDGVSLRQILRKRPRRLPMPLAVGLGHMLARTVAHIHGQGVLHRDLKPGNVMFAAGGQIKLTDFGIAHLEGTRMTATGVVLGSPTYMAPEQLSGDRAAIGERTDVYALGTLIYECIEGLDPFRIKAKEDLLTVLHRKVEAAPKPMKRCDDDALRALLLRCVAPAADDRPADMEELGNGLAVAAQDRGAPTGSALGQAILREVGLDDEGQEATRRERQARADARDLARTKQQGTAVGGAPESPSRGVQTRRDGGRRTAILGTIAIAAALGILTFLLGRGCFG
jgi:serine/threonine protein kinase